MINYKKIDEKALLMSSLFGITLRQANIILLEGYTLCQDDIITAKELNTNTLL